MKRILKNKQYQFVAIVILAIIMMIIFSSFNSEAKNTDVYIKNCDNMITAQATIKMFSKYGYRVIQLTPYAINVRADGGKVNRYYAPYKYVCTNNYLLIMQKN